MADHRIDKFEADGVKLLSEKPIKAAKVNSEIKKFRTWIVKHQDENVPDAQKGKLLSTVQAYHKTAATTPDIAEASHSLIEDLLMLPEGKLVTAKAKRTALKWLEEGRQGKSDGAAASEDHLEEERWQVFDCEGDTATLWRMDDAGGTTMEVTLHDEVVRAEVASRFETGEELFVFIVGDRVRRVE